MRALVVGCGYVGLALARELVAQGHQVVGIRRSPAGAAELAEAGVEAVIADITAPDFAPPGGRFDWIVYAVSAGHDTSVATYRAVYVEAQRRLIAHFSGEGLKPAKWIYTGSTSVYGQTDGSVVKESSPTQPLSDTGPVLLEAESVLATAARAGFPAVILRVAGIYGPDRVPLFERFLHNEVRIAGRGIRSLNMIHRDDVVGTVLSALRSARAGETYNVVDQEPVTEIHFYTWMAETLGKWVPSTVPDPAPGTVPSQADRKISNRRLSMELGYRLKYPNFRLGYTAEFKRLADAGLLEVAPEDRG